MADLFAPLSLPPAPEHAPESQLDVSILHPAYPALQVLAFPCLDKDRTAVHYGLVLAAARIVANNRDGFLSTTKETSGKVDAEYDSFLLSGIYYYLLNGDHHHKTYKYPICTSFRSWTPPSTVPSEWLVMKYDENDSLRRVRPPAVSTSAVSDTIKILDERCLITGASSGKAASHLIPNAEDKWFRHHQMALRVPHGMTSVTHTTNLIALRADIYAHIFDLAHFIIAPICGRAVLYFIKDDCLDHIFSFHGRYINIPYRILSPFLFVRFAWAVLDVASSLTSGLSDLILVPVPTGLSNPIGASTSKKRKTDHGTDQQDGASPTSSTQNGDPDKEQTAIESEGFGFDAYSHEAVQAAQEQDAALTASYGPELNENNKRFFLHTSEDMYPAFSKYRRLGLEYIQKNPVREVTGTQFANLEINDDGATD